MAKRQAPPTSYGVLLYPGFEVLDVAGPIECLNTLTDNLTDSNLNLAVIGRPVDSQNPLIPADVSPANPRNGSAFQSAQVYKPTHTFATAPPLDVLIIGGGWGTFPVSEIQDEVAFVKKVFPSLKYLFTVCTGSVIAAEAGVLDGHKATSNKANWMTVTPHGPKTHWIAQARWVVSGKIWTTSGVSAGMDGMMAFLQHVYNEEAYPGLLQTIVNNMEYRCETDAAEDPFAEIFNAKDIPPQV